MTCSIGVFHVVPDMNADPAIVARAAEDLGFSSYWVPEHAILPVDFRSNYAGNLDDDGDVVPPPDYLWQMPDPWIALARASAVTSRIRLGTAICLVPEHNPLILANEVASLDHYCGGRVNFGIGAGWNREESEILGVDFDHRWTQTRECIEIMRALWTEDAAGYEGKYYSFPPVRCYPKPAQRPHPPIYLGSIGSPRVLQRVAKWGDGWVPLTDDFGELAKGRQRLSELCAENNRDPASISISLLAPLDRCRTAKELADAERAGADEVIIWTKTTELNDMLDELKGLADELIPTPAG